MDIITSGQRTAYVLGELPREFALDDPADFSADEYTSLRNCASGLAYIFDEHVKAVRAVDSDPQWQQYALPFRAQKVSEARGKVTAETLKSVARLERIADGAEREADELHASLTQADKVEPAQASVCVSSYQALSPEKRVQQIHDLSRLLAADSGADGRTRAAAREYLGALLNVNVFAGLLDETSRAFVTRVLAESKDAAAYSRSRHLRLAGRAIKESQPESAN